MNEDVVADLKQFITATVSQATAHLATKTDVANLDIKLDTIADTLAEDLTDHDRRITALESRTT